MDPVPVDPGTIPEHEPIYGPCSRLSCDCTRSPGHPWRSARASQDLDHLEELPDSRAQEVPGHLPSFAAVQEPNFKWGEMEGSAFTEVIDRAYAEIVHWCRNFFKVPSGKVGKALC